MSRRNESLTVGARFSRWEILQELSRDKKSNRWFLCVCSCPMRTEKPVRGSRLLNKQSRSCGCLQREVVSARCRKRPFESLYNRLKRTAERCKHKADLTYEEFLLFTKLSCCHYCSRSLDWSSAQAYNLDRKDNLKGYSKDNLVVCCYVCNRTKGNLFSYKEFLILAPALERIRSLRENS